MEDNTKKLQEMQMLEQNLQNLLMQKQAFEIELSETIAALKEVESSKEQVFKVIGQLMIQADNFLNFLLHKEVCLRLVATQVRTNYK